MHGHDSRPGGSASIIPGQAHGHGEREDSAQPQRGRKAHAPHAVSAQSGTARIVDVSARADGWVGG